MAAPSRHRLATTLLVLLSSAPFLAAAAEPADKAKQKGVLWDMTSKMSMEGMPMELPAQKMKVCVQKDQPPVMADEQHKCTNSDFKKDGTKITWKSVCAGPPEMTGEGEITFNDADNYTGALKFASSQGSMTVKLTGKRVGDCDLPQK